MIPLYEVTILLNLTLIAMTVTVFVFAVSLLGRTIEIAAQKKVEARQKQGETIKKEIEEIQKELEKMRKTGELGEMKRLNKLKKDKRKYEKELKRIHKRYQLFRVKRGVLYPSSFFLASLILAVVAKALGSTYSPFLWIVALVLLVLAGYRLFQCLKVIEAVAIVSGEMAEKKAIEISKSALAEYEETKRPKLVLYFEDKGAPFHFKKDSTVEIGFSLIFTQGDIAREAETWFLAPEGFDFPNITTWKQKKTLEKYPNYLTAKLTWKESLKKGISHPNSLSLKTPSETGKFTLAYRIYCEGFSGKSEEFEVIVE